MSSEAKKLSQKLDRQAARKEAGRMTTVGREEIVIFWENEASKQYAVARPGIEIFTFQYSQAKAAGMVLKVGETFHFKRTSERGHEMACWLTCYLDQNGCIVNTMR